MVITTPKAKDGERKMPKSPHHDRRRSSQLEEVGKLLSQSYSAVIDHATERSSGEEESRGLQSSAAIRPSVADEEVEGTPWLTILQTYVGYFTLVAIGHLCDLIGKWCRPTAFKHLREQNGYAPLTSGFESFYSRRLFYRIRDCWNRPMTGVPGATLTLLERKSEDSNNTFQLTGRKLKVDNLSSYNYLGFAESHGKCADDVVQCLQSQPVGVDSTRAELGTLPIHRQTEEMAARFVGKEAAMIFGMGFGTNSTMIPALVGKGSLIISDELNHASLVAGCRLSGASIVTFKHNDPADLEQVLRYHIIQGQPRTHRPWKKILVIVEGLYSMEGTIVRLPAILELKKRYKFYLFIDEAHSIGALGTHGKGVCDFWGIDASHVDILMGTFTKSFGASGGYIAGSKALIEHFRASGHGYIYCEPMAPAICQQVITALTIIVTPGGEGARRLATIHESSVYFMRRLKEMGFIVYGDEGSPVIPLLIFNPAKIAAFSREALSLGMAVVVVGYPATPIITSRVRFCISAAHTREQLDSVLERVSEIGDKLWMKVSSRSYQFDR